MNGVFQKVSCMYLLHPWGTPILVNPLTVPAKGQILNTPTDTGYKRELSAGYTRGPSAPTQSWTVR